jgi:predicted permease
MKTLRAILVRLAGLFRRKRHEAEMSEELRAHLDGLIERNVAAGMSAEEARFAALRAFGGITQIAERARDERRSARAENFIQDLRYSLRALRKNPSFTLTAVLTLAFGIGATTAIFTAVNALILRPLPVKKPDELVVIVLPLFRRPGTSQPISLRLFEEFRTRARSLSEIALVSAYGGVRPLVASEPSSTGSDFVLTEFVSGNFFSVLGSPATIGRTLIEEDDRRDRPQSVVVLSHGFWTRRFGADPLIIGKTVTIERAPFTVVGVAAAGFFGIEVGRNTDVWCPLHSAPLLDPERPPPTEDDWLGLPIGRLRAGMLRAQAQVELNGIFQQDLAWQAAGRNLNNPATRELFVGRKLEVQPGADGVHLGSSMRAQYQQPIVVLMAVSGVVLLVTCCNIAGLLLTRSASRQREMAVRAAIGAGRLRLIRVLLGESLMLTFAGGLAGFLIAQWGTSFLAGYLPATDALDLTPDGRVLVFSLVLTLGTGIACGLWPALQSSRVDFTTALKTQSSTLAASPNAWLNRSFVVAQVALSFALLIAAGLFGRTLHNLRTIDAGFLRDHLTLINFDPGKTRPGLRGAELHQRVLGELANSPGVLAATMTTDEPLLSGGGSARLKIDHHVPAPGEFTDAKFVEVGPRFFATLGLPLLRGRDFAAGDFGSGPAQVVVVNQTMVRQFFGDEDPVGRSFRWGRRAFQIVGVAKDTPVYEEVRANPAPRFYLPFLPEDPDEIRPMIFVVRTTGNSPALAAGFRDLVRRLAPEARVASTTMDAAVEGALSRERALAQLSRFFSAFTLLLSGLGLYGLLSHGVVRRTREIGVRMALGAQLGEVATLILGQGLGLVLLGCGVGVAGALIATRFLGRFLYGVAPADPFTVIATTLLMLVVALLACWLPARRATKVDPLVALRTE